MRNQITTGAALIVIASSATADTLHVPGQYGTITEAITASVDGDVISLAPGWYGECIDYKGKNIRIGGPAAGAAAIISGWGLDNAVVTFDDGEGPDAVLQNVTIVYGKGAPHPTSGMKVGGGIWISNSSPSVINCRLTRNDAADGGGLYVYQGSPLIEGCMFDRNYAADCGGGMASSESTPIVHSCIFESNQALHGGGGLMSRDESDIEVSECMFYQNLVTDNWGGGGGMMTAYGSALVENCQFEKNSAPSGGGLRNQSGSLLVRECSFMKNSAMNTGSGGGLTSCASMADATIEVYDCAFKQNHAPNGGGVWIVNLGPGATDGQQGSKAILDGCYFISNTGVDGVGLGTRYAEVIMSNTYFADNKSSTLGHSYGGGIYSWRSALVMDEVVFRGNQSKFGGGVWHVEEVLNMSNCTFLNNLAYDGGGGLYTRESTCVDQGSMFVQNNSGNSMGGGWLIHQGDIQAHDTQFRHHYSSVTGAGVAALDTNLLFDSVVFQGNSSQYPGGGIWSSNSTVAFDGCEFLENDSHTNGGAGAFIGGTAYFHDSSFDHNFSQDGGALYLDAVEADIEACSFTSNMALDLGYTVLGYNSSFAGGAILAIDPAWIKDTFFCANTPNHVQGPWIDLLGNTMSDNCLPCPWDVDADGDVDIDDAILVWMAVTNGNCPSCDVNGDGIVDMQDVIEVLSNIGQC
jgi:hypothetical protein